MSNTFNSIYEQADENYRLQFAKMVREYFDANVLPPPLNILELCLNRCAEEDGGLALEHRDGLA